MTTETEEQLNGLEMIVNEPGVDTLDAVLWASSFMSHNHLTVDGHSFIFTMGGSVFDTDGETVYSCVHGFDR